MGLLTALNLPPAAHKPKTKPASGKAPAVSGDAKQFTLLVMKTLPTLDPLAAAGIPEVARLRKAIIEAAHQGKEAKGREAARKALGLITMEIDLLQTKVAAQAITAKAKAKAQAAQPKPVLYDVKIGGRQLEGATKAEVCAELQKVVSALEAELKRGFEAHCYELQIQREEPFAAWVSGGISSLKATVKGEDEIDLLDLSIWDAPQLSLRNAQAALKRQDIEAVMAAVPEIKRGCVAATGKVSKHNADSIESAETAVEGLRKVEDASADIVGEAAEKLGGKAAGVAAKAGLKSVMQGAEQMSAIYIAETQKEMDWGAVAKEGAASVASDVAGLILKGALLDRFSSLFGSYLSKANIGDTELQAMQDALGIVGPLNRDAIMSGAHKHVRDFLFDKCSGLVTDAIGDLIKGKKESDPPMPMDEMLKKTAASVAGGQGLKAFIAYVVSKGVKPK